MEPESPEILKLRRQLKSYLGAAAGGALGCGSVIMQGLSYGSVAKPADNLAAATIFVLMLGIVVYGLVKAHFISKKLPDDSPPPAAPKGPPTPGGEKKAPPREDLY